jgi:hypothetical protein
MNYTVILIVIIIIIIIILNKHKNINEKYIDMYDEDTVNKVFNNCGNRKGRVQFERIKIMGKINNKSKEQFLLDLAFPIGSYYVQFEKKGSNKTSEAFPVENSPEFLFGGDWQEQWPYESIFFRTSGTLANENRINGFQNYATKRLKGDTTYSQVDRYLWGKGNSGVFDAFVRNIGTDNGHDNDWVSHSYFDLSGYYNSEKESFRNKAYEDQLAKDGRTIEMDKIRYISDLETRPRNRIIKVWKRVQRDASGNKPKLENGYPYTKFDQFYYEGPEQHKYLDKPIPGIPTDFYGIDTFEAAMNFCNSHENECTQISFAEGTWRYGINQPPRQGGLLGTTPIPLLGDDIGGAQKPNYKVWERKVSDVRIVNQDETK